MRRFIFAGLLCVLAACGSPTGSTSVPVSTSVPAPTTISALPTAPTLATGTSAEAPREIMQAASLALETITKKTGDQFKLVSSEEKDWSDSGVGCPDPDMMYMQVITPGFMLTYTDGVTTYTVHTDSNGQTAVVCDNGKPMKVQ